MGMEQEYMQVRLKTLSSTKSALRKITILTDIGMSPVSANFLDPLLVFLNWTLSFSYIRLIEYI